MTSRCLDLDPFFDGELATDQAAAFRHHLAACVRCQAVLHGRMQESVAADDHDPVLARGSRRSVVERPPIGEEVAAPPAELPEPVAATKPDTPVGSARRRGRILLIVGPIVAAAAAAPLWLIPPSHESAVIALEIEPGGAVARGMNASGSENAHVGDVLQTSIRADHRTVWVYLDERRLVVACPGSDLRCGSDGNKIALRLSLNARGRYTIVALESDMVISAPAEGQTLDSATASLPASVHRVTQDIDVD